MSFSTTDPKIDTLPNFKYVDSTFNEWEPKIFPCNRKPCFERKCPILHLSVALQQQAAAAGVGFCQHTQIAYVFASDVRQGDRGKQGKSKKESLPMSASFPYGIFCHVTESQPQSPDKKQYIGAEQFWLYGAPLLLVQPQPPANEPLCRFFREMCVALFCGCFPKDALT